MPSFVRPNNDEESSDESEGSHISATPPRKKTYICRNDEASSKVTKAQACVRNLSLNASKSSRLALCEINQDPSISGKYFQEGKTIQEGNLSQDGKGFQEDKAVQEGKPCQDNKDLQEGKGFQEANAVQDVKFSGEEKMFQEMEVKASSSFTNIHRVGDSVVASQASFYQQAPKLGFTIKLRKHGEFDKENVEAERIPAGFFLNRISTFRNTVKPITRTIFPKESDTCELNTSRFSCMERTSDKIQTPGLLQSNPPFGLKNDTISDVHKQVGDAARLLSENSMYGAASENMKEISIKKKSANKELTECQIQLMHLDRKSRIV